MAHVIEDLLLLPTHLIGWLFTSFAVEKIINGSLTCVALSMSIGCKHYTPPPNNVFVVISRKIYMQNNVLFIIKKSCRAQYISSHLLYFNIKIEKYHIPNALKFSNSKYCKKEYFCCHLSLFFPSNIKNGILLYLTFILWKL